MFVQGTFVTICPFNAVINCDKPSFFMYLLSVIHINQISRNLYDTCYSANRNCMCASWAAFNLTCKYSLIFQFWCYFSKMQTKGAGKGKKGVHEADGNGEEDVSTSNQSNEKQLEEPSQLSDMLPDHLVRTRANQET